MMTPEQIARARPEMLPEVGAQPLARGRERMEAAGQWHARQTIGRRWAIGCVALEVTQRCNLDCALCYLSESSEAVRDVPLDELFRRIDLIRAHYGPHTNVQVTGGDPTLRRRDELVAIVARVRQVGMRPSLFTNGIRASRDLLAELCQAGLADVAFHVDLTQERKGYGSEAALNAVRLEYIERTRGLPLSVYFNTTVFDGNWNEIPDLVAFFVRHADAVRLASFQLQADTGRGRAGASRLPITMDGVMAAIRTGAAADISFDTPLVGHPGCNRYAMTLVANGRVHTLCDDARLMTDLMAATVGMRPKGDNAARDLAALSARLLLRPRLLARTLCLAAGKAWSMRRDLWAASGRAHRLSFYVHAFMDASCLDCNRVAACIFMVATGDGPISMCLHNAKRDAFILPPTQIEREGRIVWWDPLTGGTSAEPPIPRNPAHTRKTMKGRLRLALLQGSRVRATP